MRLEYISNFTDYDPLACEPDVELVYSVNPVEIENADMVIVPGSKNTVKDLLCLKERGLDMSIRRAAERGIPVMGMCGGYQILGKKIYDPHGVESPFREIDGIGLLDIETVFNETKTTCRVEAEVVRKGLCQGSTGPLKGYEIHMGESRGDTGLFRLKRFNSLNPSVGHGDNIPDGSMNGHCWGTYIHGIFENDGFRREIINNIRKAKGLPPMDVTCSYVELKEKAIDDVARIVSENIDMEYVKGLVGL